MSEMALLPATTSAETPIAKLFGEARQGRCLLLRVSPARESEAAKALMAQLAPAQCTELAADPEGNPDVAVAGLPEDTLCWIEAARLYEGLLRELSSGERFQFIFCLDRWTACFLDSAGGLKAEAKWVYVEGAKSQDRTDHDRRMAEWIASLPFDYKLSISSINKLPRALNSATPAVVADRAAYRRVFVDPDEKLVVLLASSVGESRAVIDSSVEIPKLRWIILGADPPQFSDKTRRVQVLGAMPPSVVRGILDVADACAVFSEVVLDSLSGCTRNSLPLLVSTHLEAKARGMHRQVTAIEGDSAEALAVAVSQALGLSRPHQRRITPVLNFELYNNWGIGDELLLSAVAREIARTRRDVRLWIRSRFGFRFPGYVERGEPPADAARVEVIYQNSTLYGPSHHSPFPGHLVQQMLDKFALDTGIAVRAENVRPEVVIEKAEPRRSRSVVLHSRPNPRLPSKDWGVERWMCLCEILHAAGVQLIQVGATVEPLLPHVEDRRGMLVADVPDLVARAGAVVCLVGFLMHAAAATQTPAVVIFGGREHPAIDGYPDQVHLSSDPLPCRGRWGCHLAADISCPFGLRCMEGIVPQSVAASVLALIGTQQCRTTS